MARLGFPIAPRIDARLIEALARIDDPTVPIAATNRRLGVVAGELDFCKPSYEQVRTIVHELRSVKRRRSARRLKLLEISLRGGLKSRDEHLDLFVE